MPNVLIIGPGAIARRHIDGFRKGGGEVVGVAGRDRDRAREFADTFRIPNVYTSHREALEHCDAEIVSVATPPTSHAEITIDALEAGKHVLCEKPFATQADGARSMVAAADRSGRVLGCWSSRHQFMWGLKTAIRMAREGSLGRIVHMHVDFQWRDLVPGISFQPESRWFLDSSKNGGGVLVDWGSYWIDMILALLPRDDEPRTVLSQTFLGMDDPDLPSEVVRDAEEVAVAMVTFTSGASAMVQLASRVHQDTNHRLRVWGTEAGATFNPFDTSSDATVTVFRDVNGEQRTETLGAPGPLLMHDGPPADFIDAVREGREPAGPGWRAARVVEITEAAYRSAREGRAVDLR